MRYLRRLGALAVVSLLSAQQAPELKILVIGGEGSINNVKQRTAREPIVEVRDRNNRPVAGAVVLFQAPGSGPSGTFLGGSNALRVTTDVQGRAAGQGFQPNGAQGNFQIQVTATFESATATTAIHMQNVGAGAALGKVAKAGGHGKLIGIVIAAGAAVAAGAAYAATHNGGSNSTPTAPTATISAGTGTVGGRP